MLTDAEAEPVVCFKDCPKPVPVQVSRPVATLRYKSGECWGAEAGPMFLDFSSRMVPALTPTPAENGC